MKNKFLLLLLTLLCCCMASAQEVKKIAILETVDVEGNVTQGVKLTVRTYMAKAITEFDGYEALARVNLDQVMGEHNFQRSGNVSDDQIRKIGEMTGATYILICEVAYIDKTNITLTSQIIDIESTQYISVAIEQSSTDVTSIMEACRSLVQQLLSELGDNSQKDELNDLTISSKVLISFKDQKLNIDESEDLKITKIVEFLENNPDVNIILMGFSDSRIGSPEQVRTFTSGRLEMVYTMLVAAYGISSDRIILQSMFEFEESIGLTDPEFAGKVVCVFE